MLGRACSLVESHGLFVSAVVSIKSHPANSRQVALPHLHANFTGLPSFVRLLRISPRLPPSLPTTSVDQNAKAYSHHPHSSSLRFPPYRIVLCPFHQLGGKDNPPPSVIYIVHQHLPGAAVA